MNNILEGFVVVDSDGKVRRQGKGRYAVSAFYVNQSSAINRARVDGDAVVPVRIDLSKTEPVFIRKRVQKTEE